MNRILSFVTLQISFFAGFVFACTYYTPVAGISFPENTLTVPLYSSLVFNGDDSYDRDYYGVNPQITIYEWEIIPPGASSGDKFQYSSPNKSIAFNEIGTWKIRLKVMDNDAPDHQSWSDGFAEREVVVRDPAAFPLVKNVSVESVDNDSASMKGELLSIGNVGGTTCTIDLHSGTTEAGEYGVWDYSHRYSASQGVGQFQDTISATGGFEPGKLHYFRFQATNNTYPALIDWANTEEQDCYRFVTPPGASHDDIYSCWKFNSVSGAITPDSVGGNNGTLVNMDTSNLVPGKFGSALSFNGVDESVSLSQSAIKTEEFTVCGWANMTGASNTTVNPMFYQYGCVIPGSRYIGVSIYTGWDPYLVSPRTASVANIRSSTATESQSLVGPMPAYNSGWHHYALTVSKSRLTFYIDGVEVASEINRQTGSYDVDQINYPATKQVTIGGGSGSYNKFKGSIDDVRCYSNALSAEDIRMLAAEPVMVSTSHALTWTSGQSDYPVLHDIYLGTNPASVLNADHNDEEYQGRLKMPYYKPEGLIANTTYYWRVDEIVLDPYNDYAERISGPDHVEELFSFATGVENPVNVRAYPGNAKVCLSWNINDNTNVDGYYVYRASEGTDYQKVNQSLITTPLGYEDINRVNGTTYYYYVVAVDGSIESARSEEVSATPQGNIGNTIFVDDGASGSGSIQNPYGTIQAAINAASNGDEIVVYPGTYNETITSDNWSGTLRSIDPSDPDIVAATIIDAGANYYGFVFSGGLDIVLKGLTIKNADCGIEILAGNSISIENCIVSNNLCGIYCECLWATIKNCEIEGSINGILIGIDGTNAKIINNIIRGCTFGAKADEDSVVEIKNNEIYDNSCGIVPMENADITIVNNTIVNNDYGIYCNSCANPPVVTNCIFWGNTDSFYVSNSSFSQIDATYCCIEDGTGGAGNISDNPCFIGADDYHLSIYSPCIDAGNNDVWDGISDSNDIDGQNRRLPGWYVEDTGNGESPIVDMGADEWSMDLNDKGLPYLTSFESSSGFVEGNVSIDSSIDGWEAEEGNISINEVQYLAAWKVPSDANDYRYQYLSLGSNSTISRNFDPNYPAEIIRINCIPTGSAQINILNKNEKIISIQFGSPSTDHIYLWNGADYTIDTGISYSAIASGCRTFLGYTGGSPCPELFSYENTWIEFEIRVDWNTQTYSVLWNHMNAPGGQVIAANQAFASRCLGFDKIAFVVAGSENMFCINRISVSNEVESGGELGEGKDIWLDYPSVDVKDPLRGCPLMGSAWYDQLGKYVIKVCPVGEYSDPPKTVVKEAAIKESSLGEGDISIKVSKLEGVKVVCKIGDVEKEVWIDPWKTVAVSGCTKKNANLGFWDTLSFMSGDYYLKIEAYDDLGRSLNTDNDGIMYETRTINDVQKVVKRQYTILGRRGKKYHYEEKPDITVNWPGSFPFEFKRTYDDNLLGLPYPLFFGWTHNHSIRIMENTTSWWLEKIVDDQAVAEADRSGLGIGRLYFCEGAGGRLFIGHLNPQNNFEVIYQPDDHQRDYIIRKSIVDKQTDPQNPVFEVFYTYYAADGRTMRFGCPYPESGSHSAAECVTGTVNLGTGIVIPNDIGLVDWMVSAGVQEQADRFGNALSYTWNNEIFGRGAEMQLSIMEISNNRTPAKLVFDVGPMGPYLYSKLKLSDGAIEHDIMRFSLSLEDGHVEKLYCYRIDRVESAGDNYRNYDDVQEIFYTFEKIKLYDWETYSSTGDIIGGSGVQTDQRFTYDLDDTLKEIQKSLLPWRFQCSTEVETYQYSYDSLGNMTISMNNYRYSRYRNCDNLLKNQQTTVTPEGAVIKNKITTHDVFNENEKFDPNAYMDSSAHDSNPPYWHLREAGFGYYADQYSYSMGGGGVVDSEYFYEDTRFPNKPTRSKEYQDNDGDGTYDEEGKTKVYKYNDYGSPIEQRVYVNATNYVLTEYAYHPAYSFPIRQTTWQDYCTDDAYGNPVKPAGKKVENQWVYGTGVFNQDGTPIVSGDPNLNRYLVQERQLLDNNDTANESDDTWSRTDYEYYPMTDPPAGAAGQLKFKKVWTDATSYKVDYYRYDNNGFLSKEWQGVPLNVSDQVVLDGNGNPLDPQNNNAIVNPQKRYCFNDVGLNELQADNMGHVIMSIYTNHLRLMKTRDYYDSTAMTRSDFDVSAYEEDKWLTQKLYGANGYKGQPSLRGLPTGGQISELYQEDINYYSYYQDMTSVKWAGKYKFFGFDGPIFQEKIQYDSDSSMDNGHVFYSYYIYDAMNRNVNKYQYNYCLNDIYETIRFSNPFIVHTECGYYASGQKKFEKVKRVKRCLAADGNLLFDQEGKAVFGVPILQKFEEYEYDILDRITKQTMHIKLDEEGKDAEGCPAQVTRLGYDAVGNRIYTVDPEGNVLFTDYDNASRKTVEYFAILYSPNYYNPDGSLNITAAKGTNNINCRKRESTEYYLDGKVKSKTQYDTNGTTILACSQYVYDSRGRTETVSQIIEDTNANNQMDAGDNIATTFYAYSDNGTATGPLRNGGNVGIDDKYHIVITDAAGTDKKTGILLSWLGKPNFVTYPSRDYEEYIYYNYSFNRSDSNYDPVKAKFNGLLEKKAVWKNGVTDPMYVTYEYDEFGKVSKIIYPDNGGYLEYAYTPRYMGEYGKVAKITDHRADDTRPGGAGSTYEFTYDPWSENVMSYTNQDDYKISYDYNTAWNRKTAVEVNDLSTNTIIYSIRNNYDLAGRMIQTDAIDDYSTETMYTVADFAYDANGNRDMLSYHTQITGADPNYYINYAYNTDNMLTNIATAGGSEFTFEAADYGDIDGLGRLKFALENQGESNEHSYTYTYDMMSQLLSAQATNINGFEHVRDEFSYNEDGNVTGHWYTKLSGQNETYTSDTFVYTNNGQSDIMAGTGTGSANPFTLDNDDNGNITKLPTDSENDTVLWNWDNKLANAQKNTSSIAVKYDPMGNRVWRQSTVDSVTTGRKYIVDISGGLPVILCEIDTSTSSLTKSYIYSDGQILSQRIHDDQDPYDYTPYYYVHDRLGSVRLMIDNSGTAVNSYTYKPYGQFYDGECNETMLDNPWAFTGQYYDEEIAQYYLRARQYDPKMMRFTSRDPAESVRQEPLTLHKYLYCINSPMLYVDLKGESPLGMLQSILDATIVYNETINLTAYFANTGDWDFLTLATFMSRCMLPVMLTGFLDPIFPIENLGEFAEDTIWEYAYEEAFPFFYNFGTKGYLLSGLSSSFINAHYMYGMFTGEFGVTYGEMDDYYEWMGR